MYAYEYEYTVYISYVHTYDMSRVWMSGYTRVRAQTWARMREAASGLQVRSQKSLFIKVPSKPRSHCAGTGVPRGEDEIDEKDEKRRRMGRKAGSGGERGERGKEGKRERREELEMRGGDEERWRGEVERRWRREMERWRRGWDHQG